MFNSLKLCNKLETLFLTLLFCLVGAGQGFAAMDSWMNHKSLSAPGVNTTTGCYEVSTPAQLAYFSGGKPSKCIELTADLNMEGEDDGYFWVPIAAGGSATAVNFNGNGHIIRNLYISAEEILNVKAYKDKKYAQNLGLIGAFSGKVENVILENIQVYAYGNNFSTTNADNPVKGPLSIGTVVGWQSGGGQVLNCYVTGTMLTIGDGQAVGGIVGNNGGGTISNCYSAVNITASGIGYVGGIAGYAKAYNNGSVTISSCVYAGETLSATGEGTIFIKEEGVERYFVSQAGAIVGNHYNGKTTFENVYYDSEKFENGVGADMGGSTVGSTTGTTDLNSSTIACTLNGGVIQENGSCSKDGAWSAGGEGLSLNGYGADGFKVVFYANGGSFAGGTTFVKYVKSGNVVNNDGVDDPTWGEDHAFVGWALSSDATGPENLGEPAKGKAVYAVWNPVYTITFNAAPGKFIDGKTEQTVKVERGKKISIGDEFGNPKRTDFYFRGWALNENPSVEDALVDEETGLDVLPDASENRTFYAVWTEVPTYIVTFNANGHGPTISKYLEVRENQIIEGLTESEFGSATGYVLDGWCQDSECENEFVFHDTPIKEDVTVYAKWDKQSYSVNYVLNCDGNCSATNASSYTVDGLALNAPNAWDEGHHFMGWSEDTEGKDVKNSIPAGETGDKTLYAIWKVDVFTITYNAGAYGNGELIPIVTKEYGEQYKLLDARFAREGFTQDAWISSDGNKEVVYDTSKTITVHASLNLYPHWKAVEYDITYNGVDASELPEDYPTKYTYEAAVTLPEPTRAGYEFAGWYDNADFDNDAVTEISLGSTGDTTFYAKWNKVYPFLVNDFGAIKVYEDESGKLTAELDGASSGSVDAITAEQNVRVDAISFSRTFPVNETSSDMKFSSIVLPFTVDWAKISGAEFYEFVDVDLTKHQVSFCPAADENHTQLIANTPYIVRATSQNISFNLNGEKVLLNTTETNNPVSGTATKWMFKGMYEYKKWNEGDEELGSAYGYTANAINNLAAGQFAKNAAGAFIRPFRAYLLKMNAQQGNRLAFPLKKSSAALDRASIDEDSVPGTLDVVIVERETGETTAIGTLDTRTGEIKFIDSWFDMKGRRLNAKPTTKGIYYYNGKRVIVR